jgi:hypothetical protein
MYYIASKMTTKLNKNEKPKKDTPKGPPKKNKRTLKEVYEESKETNALKLSELANTSASYAKQFLKKQNEAFDVVGKIDLKNTNDVPCGSSVSNHWQADVMFLHDYKKLRDNKKHIGVLTLLNTTTRQAQAQPVKSTQAKDINKAMMDMIISIDFDIAVLRTDGGPEFSNNEFKKSIANSWTTRIYQIIERTGPNFWRVNDAGDGEIKQWTTAMMRRATQKAYDEQTAAVKRDEANKKAIRVARAEAKEQQNVSKAEQKTTATRTRGEGMTTRARARKKVDYAKLAGKK